MIDWLLEVESVCRFELIFYWVLALILSLVAGVGWGLYSTERKSLRRRGNCLPNPLDRKENRASPIDNPNQDKENIK